MEVFEAERLKTRTPDLEVLGSSLTRRVFFKTRLYSTLSLFTQLYKWVPATHCLGGGGGGGGGYPAMD